MLPKNVEPMKDKAGNYTGGLQYKLEGIADVNVSASMGAEVIRRKDQPESSGQETS